MRASRACPLRAARRSRDFSFAQPPIAQGPIQAGEEIVFQHISLGEVITVPPPTREAPQGSYEDSHATWAGNASVLGLEN